MLSPTPEGESELSKCVDIYYNDLLKVIITSVIGLVVEYIPATDETGVRFPDYAHVLLY